MRKQQQQQQKDQCTGLQNTSQFNAFYSRFDRKMDDYFEMTCLI